MKPGLGLSWVLLTFLLGPVAAAQSSTPLYPATVNIEYLMGSQAAGDVNVQCEAAGLVWPPATAGVLDLEAAGGKFRYFETWENRTVLLGSGGGLVHVRRGADAQHERSLPVPAGPVRVEWTKQGEALVFGRDPFTRNIDAFEARVMTNSLEAAPTIFEPITGEYWIQHDTTIVMDGSGVHQWSRVVTPQGGSIEGIGNVSIYLEGATVRGPDGFEESVPPWKEVYAKTPSEHAGVWTYRYHHALLELVDAKFKVGSAGKQLICLGLSSDFSGRFTAFQAKGEAESGGEHLALERQALTLVGDFSFDERPKEAAEPSNPWDRPPVQFQAQGEFSDIGVDFQTSTLTPKVSAVGTGVIVAAGFAAGGWALWKLLAFLFTRLRQERILSSSTRERIHDAIQSRPGITLRELQEATGLGASTLRYQLRVLARHGLARGFKLGGRLCFSPMSRPVEAIRRNRVLELDGRLPGFLANVGPNGILARQAVSWMRQEWGLSRSGSWKVVDRAVAADLVRRERVGREVRLWRTE